MQIEIIKVFRPLSIKIECNTELEELVGVLAQVKGSPFIDDLYSKLSNELGAPMLGLFKGKLEQNY